MPSTFEQLNPTRVKFTVEIPFSELKPTLDKAYKEIAEQVNIPGFRKGKVPAAVIDQRFGRGVVIQEALETAIPHAYQAAVTEAKVVPLGQPEVEVSKLEDNEVVEFTAEVDVRPEFELPDFEKIKAEVETLEVTDADVEERVELLRERFAKTTTVERAAAEGDLVVVNLIGRRDGADIEDASAEAVTYKIGSGNMVEGLDEAVIGLSAGESKVFSSTLAGGSERGKEADIEVTVVKVQEQELPDVDDEFAQLVSEFDTVDEMKTDLRGAIQLQKKYSQRAEARDRVLEEVLKVVDFPLPEVLLKAELEARRAQIDAQLAQAGLTVEQYLEEAEDETAKTVEEFWADIDQRGTDALRAQMVLEAYADTHEITVDQQDLTALLFRRAQQNGTTPQEEANHMMEHNHMAEWFGEIRRGKALEAIVTAATVVDGEGAVVTMVDEAPEAESAEEKDGEDANEQE